MSPAPTAATPRGCTNLKLRQLTRRVSRDYDALIGAASGLKTTQYSLLGHLALLGPLRPADLAARLLLEPSTLTRNLQPLIAQGWVRVDPGPDRRSRLVALTDAGRAQHAGARSAWKQAQQALTTRLGAARIGQLHALLDECLAVLAEDGGGPAAVPPAAPARRDA
ncbi:MAG: MarR family winged helix-turn-helix transcriptional regulator [Rubrivivax sp.]